MTSQSPVSRSHRTVLAVLIVLIGCASGRPRIGPMKAIAVPSRSIGGAKAPAGSRTVLVESRMADRFGSAIEGGVREALSALDREPACRAIFEELGRDGHAVIGMMTFILADARAEVKVCPGAQAFTVVGGSWVGVCRNFAFLNESEAAVVILHEGLHHAGLTEWPFDLRALKSWQISAMVRERCGLTGGN